MGDWALIVIGIIAWQFVCVMVSIITNENEAITFYAAFGIWAILIKIIGIIFNWFRLKYFQHYYDGYMLIHNKNSVSNYIYMSKRTAKQFNFNDSKEYYVKQVSEGNTWKSAPYKQDIYSKGDFFKGHDMSLYKNQTVCKHRRSKLSRNIRGMFAKERSVGMRLWHYRMIKFLPKAQLVSQWRECVCIATNIAKNGSPNHLLVNAITEYPISNFNVYCNMILKEMNERGYNVSESSIDKLEQAVGFEVDVGDWLDRVDIFDGWHNKEYLRVCYGNLYEKWKFGVGKSRITDEEWQRLLDGYKAITGGAYMI